jgi:hypothetical protein
MPRLKCAIVGSARAAPLVGASVALPQLEDWRDRDGASSVAAEEVVGPQR